MADEKKKRGQPPFELTQEFADEVCSAIATSHKGLKRLRKDHPHWPSHETIYQLLLRNKSFSDQYARAKMQQAEVLVDEIIDISDESSLDEMVDENGNSKIDHENINRAKLRVDSRKWIACKLIPRKYGERVHNEHSGFINHELALKELE